MDLTEITLTYNFTGHTVVITGGAMLLPGAIEMAERSFGMPVRLGVPISTGPSAQGSARVVSLPEVRVAAETDTEVAIGPVHGYVAKRSVTGTKTDTPIIETPQSITVVTADQVEAQKAQSIVDVLAYTAGVGFRESSRATEAFVLRGFQADGNSGSLYRDGTKYSSGLYQGQQEP